MDIKLPKSENRKYEYFEKKGFIVSTIIFIQLNDMSYNINRLDYTSGQLLG